MKKQKLNAIDKLQLSITHAANFQLLSHPQLSELYNNQLESLVCANKASYTPSEMLKRFHDRLKINKYQRLIIKNGTIIK